MKRVFIQDYDCHWYLIPIDKKEEFRSFCDDPCQEKEYSMDFNDCLIDGDPSFYSVENVNKI